AFGHRLLGTPELLVTGKDQVRHALELALAGQQLGVTVAAEWADHRPAGDDPADCGINPGLIGLIGDDTIPLIVGADPSQHGEVATTRLAVNAHRSRQGAQAGRVELYPPHGKVNVSESGRIGGVGWHPEVNGNDHYPVPGQLSLGGIAVLAVAHVPRAAVDRDYGRERSRTPREDQAGPPPRPPPAHHNH